MLMIVCIDDNYKHHTQISHDVLSMNGILYAGLTELLLFCT